MRREAFAKWKARPRPARERGLGRSLLGGDLVDRAGQVTDVDAPVVDAESDRRGGEAGEEGGRLSLLRHRHYFRAFPPGAAEERHVERVADRADAHRRGVRRQQDRRLVEPLADLLRGGGPGAGGEAIVLAGLGLDDLVLRGLALALVLREDGDPRVLRALREDHLERLAQPFRDDLHALARRGHRDQRLRGFEGVLRVVVLFAQREPRVEAAFGTEGEPVEPREALFLVRVDGLGRGELGAVPAAHRDDAGAGRDVERVALRREAEDDRRRAGHFGRLAFGDGEEAAGATRLLVRAGAGEDGLAAEGERGRRRDAGRDHFHRVAVGGDWERRCGGAARGGGDDE